MKKSLFLSVMLVFLAFNNAYAAKEGKTVDVFKFDLLNIKLGMDINQVNNVLKNITGKVEKINSYRENQYTNNKEVNSIRITDDHKTIFINFTPDVTVKPAKMAVSLVSYTIPGTEENIENLKKAALKKYGTPTEDTSFGLEWCTNREKGRFPICSLKGNNAILKFSIMSASLTLSTTKYDDAIKKLEDSKKAVVPQL